MDALLAAAAIQGLEKLSIVLCAEFGGSGEDYLLPTSRVPCHSLRVLDVQGCTLGKLGTAMFGHLEKLRMVWCIASPEDIQALLDSAPNLARIYLRHVKFRAAALLRCPKALVYMALMHCHGTDGIDLDAPNLRFLRYEGFLDQFPFSSTMASGRPMNLQHVQLSFCSDWSCHDHPSKEIEPHISFWKSIGSFRHLRVLRLKLRDINDIAVPPEQEDTYLSAFPDLKVLEVIGSYELDRRGAAVAIANLLCCCPSIKELRLKFKLHGDPYAISNVTIIQPEERKAQLIMEECVESLLKLKSRNQHHSADDNWSDDPDLSPLKARSLCCLETYLRKIRLKFEMECLDCFGVKIAKFLVENADVLEQMEVHDGNHRVYDHIHLKLALWRVNISKGIINIVGSSQESD